MRRSKKASETITSLTRKRGGNHGRKPAPRLKLSKQEEREYYHIFTIPRKGSPVNVRVYLPRPEYVGKPNVVPHIIIGCKNASGRIAQNLLPRLYRYLEVARIIFEEKSVSIQWIHESITKRDVEHYTTAARKTEKVKNQLIALRRWRERLHEEKRKVKIAEQLLEDPPIQEIKVTTVYDPDTDGQS